MPRQKGFSLSEETKNKISNALKGKSKSLEHNKKVSDALKGKYMGANNSHWRGGLTTNKEHKRLRMKKYKAERRLKTKGLSIKIIQLVYEDNIKRYGTLTCYLCELPIDFGNDQLEHKTPLCRGGNHEYLNLGIACKKCNNRKYNKTEQEFRLSLLGNYQEKIR